MTTTSSDLAGLSFPRLKARTRRFQLGRPRSFSVTDGLVLFVRSAGPVDPVGSLWALDPADGSERLVVDASTLAGDDAHLPPAERARRERMRESASGITGYSAAAGLVTFAVAGEGYLARIDGTGAPIRIPVDGGVVDPRLSPDGTCVAFVRGGALWAWETPHAPDAGAAPARMLCASEPDVTWGLADFAAAEELDRVRGHWWLPGSQALLVERVDESPVATAWITDPEQPSVEPRPHRYPFTGTANAAVSLWLVRRDGTRQVLALPDGIEYIASVQSGRHGTVVQVLSRDQRRQVALRLDHEHAVLIPISERTDPAWIDVMGGVPTLSSDCSLLEIVADHDSDTYRLVRDRIPVSAPGLQVSELLDEDDSAWFVLAEPEPRSTQVVRIERATHEHAVVSTMHAWTTAVVRDGILVTATANLESAQPTFEVRASGGTAHAVRSLAAAPHLDIRPRMLDLGPRALRAALLLPTGHEGSPLPVICSPYGGPHHRRVVHAAAAFAEEQWIADQGFAVLVADGRGTGGRGPAWDRAIRDDVAGIVLADQVEALQAAAAIEPALDLDRVGMRGWSFGGYLAALAVLDRPDVFHAAVAGAPVTDWRLYDTAYTERYLGRPDENPAAYERADLIRRAPALTRPLLVLHGMADDNVLVANSLGLSSALLAAGRPHAFLPLGGVTHMTPQETVAENLLLLELDFFRRELAVSV